MTVKANTTILHSPEDDVVPFEDSEELIKSSGLPSDSLIEVGTEHRLADEESLGVMVRACIDACVPAWTNSEEELLQQEWGGLCYTAAMRWITVTNDHDWGVVHGTVLSEDSDKRIDHAWCERGDIVVDLTLPFGSRIIQREWYHSVFKPDVRKMYSSSDALTLSIKNGHQGPWDESEQLKE